MNEPEHARTHYPALGSCRPTCGRGRVSVEISRFMDLKPSFLNISTGQRCFLPSIFEVYVWAQHCNQNAWYILEYLYTYNDQLIIQIVESFTAHDSQKSALRESPSTKDPHLATAPLSKTVS